MSPPPYIHIHFNLALDFFGLGYRTNLALLLQLSFTVEWGYTRG